MIVLAGKVSALRWKLDNMKSSWWNWKNARFFYFCESAREQRNAWKGAMNFVWKKFVLSTFEVMQISVNVLNI